jgi:hypothetical protein
MIKLGKVFGSGIISGRRYGEAFYLAVGVF